MKIGGHLSTSGGFDKALDRTIEIGGNTLQIFASSPRQWNSYPVTDEQIKLFIQKKKELGIDPIYFHASYLVNLAFNNIIGEKSRQKLIDELTLASKMEIRGTIVHIGSFGVDPDIYATNPELGFATEFDPYSDVSLHGKEILNNTPKDTYLILENAGNRKIGKTLEQLAIIMEELSSDRVRVCLDTCHLWAAGYDLSSEEKFEKFFEEFDRLIGMEKLEVFQVNDSKDPLGSFRDRHENIGKGTMGMDVFRVLINHPKTRDIPFILEVPGTDKKGPDKENIEVLKSLATNAL